MCSKEKPGFGTPCSAKALSPELKAGLSSLTQWDLGRPLPSELISVLMEELAERMGL